MRSLVPQVAMSPVNLVTEHLGRTNGDRSAAEEVCPTAIGGYEVLGVLGRGGMAVVYKARQPRVGRLVALKRLRFRDQDAADVARFLREAEAAAGVRHPNVVQVYEVGEDNGRPFIALEYIDGGTLADALTGAPVDPRTAAAFVEKAARAVQAAHEQGVVHRDLKPANILLAATTESPAGGRATLARCEPKVADFGLSRRIGDDRRLTLPDMLAGTPAYLAPEQVSRPGDLAPASDIYALGAILYEMLTGRPPLVGPTVLATLRLVEAANPVPPRRLQPGLPRDLEAVCLKCLDKDPRHRYSTAGDLADDLHRFLTGRPTLARPLSVAARAFKFFRRYPLPTGLAIVLFVSLVVGMAGVFWQWRAAVAARADLQQSLATEAEQRREAEGNLYIARLVQAMTLWENGEAPQARALLAACRPAPGRTDLRGWEWNYLNQQFGAETRVIRLAHWINGLALLPARPGEPAEMAVAIGRPRMNMAYVPVPGDGQTGFINPLAESTSLRRGPDLPGGATCVAAAGSIVAWGVNTGHVVLADRSSGRLVRTINIPKPVTGVGLTPDAAKVLAASEDNRVRAFAVATGEPMGEAVAPVGGMWIMAVNPAGTLTASGGNRGRVVLIDVPSMKNVGELTGTGAVTALAFSSDGERLAVGGLNGSIGLWDVQKKSEVRRIRCDAGPIYAVAFRPDGLALAAGGADRAVRLVDVESDRVSATFRGHEANVRSLVFLDGGSRIASGSQDGTVRIWDATHDPRGRRLPFSGRLNDVAFCPSDAGLLVRAAALEGELATWSVVDGRPVTRVTIPLRHQAAYPVRYMAFLSGGRRIGGFDKAEPTAPGIWDAQTGDPVTRLEPLLQRYLTCSADPAGRRFAWAEVKEDGVELHWRDDGDLNSHSAHLNVSRVWALAVDPTGRRLAALTSATRIRDELAVWIIDTSGGDPPREVARGEGMYGGMTFSPEGRFLAVSSRDLVKVIYCDDGRLIHEIPGSAAATCLAYSPNGRRLAAIGYDGVATIYDPGTGKRIFQLRGLAPGRPDDMAADARVAFSPDGRWLVSTNWDGSLNLWDGSPAGQ
jgi:WD40 repeat protein/tRNA A-37 threonylcarbamoyl transferase component Bud32